MPSLLTSTETELGGATLPHCDSRSLRLTRYARPELNDKSTPSRRDFLANVTTGNRDTIAATAYLNWVKNLPTATFIHARLEARLLLNMAGSVLENAGLNLDRYGIVTIPGSAVKACARRAALATLRQWCETGEKPLGDDLLAPAAASFDDDKPGDLLLAILRVFGCTDLEWQDWNTKKNDGNDLAWACADQWESLSLTARAQLLSDTLRGSVAFLPAYPSSRPDTDLELDVLTSHHPAFYSDKQSTATDTENPIPVYFPAVAAGAEYTFFLVPVGQPNTSHLEYAKTWLATGLTVFGLGAKTAAGYGFFSDLAPEIEARETATREAAERAAKAVAADAECSAAAKRIIEARSALTPNSQLLSDLQTKKPDQIRGLINAYSGDPRFWTNLDENHQLALLHFLTVENRTLYDAEKANQKSKVINALRQLSAKFNRTLPE